MPFPNRNNSRPTRKDKKSKSNPNSAPTKVNGYTPDGSAIGSWIFYDDRAPVFYPIAQLSQAEEAIRTSVNRRCRRLQTIYFWYYDGAGASAKPITEERLWELAEENGIYADTIEDVAKVMSYHRYYFQANPDGTVKKDSAGNWIPAPPPSGDPLAATGTP